MKNLNIPPPPKLEFYWCEWMMLNGVQLSTWFLKIYGWHAYLLISNDLMLHLVVWSVGLFLLMFRKPPDIMIQLSDELYIQAQQKMNCFATLWSLLLKLGRLFGLYKEDVNAQSQDDSTVFDLWRSLNRAYSSISCLTGSDAVVRPQETWATDSFPIVCDSGTSKSITPVFEDLIDPRPFECALNGVGSGKITHVGRVKWPVYDDTGTVVYLEDDEVYFSQQAPYRLLCPHSWKKHRDSIRFANNELEGDGATMGLTEDYQYLLTWNRGKNQCTLRLDPNNNLPTIHSVGNYSAYCCFSRGFTAYPAVIDDDGDSFPAPDTLLTGLEPTPAPVTDDEYSDSEDDASDDGSSTEMGGETDEIPSEARRVIFENEASPTEAPRLDAPLTERDKALFLSWHLRLGHAPFDIVRWAAKLGILPKKLSRCQNVVCPACMYGKQRKRPWRTKGTQQSRIKKATAPGQCVSVDQMISSVPGLMGQTTGKLTTSRYQVATIFVDHYSDVDYVHIQETTSADDTIEGKHAFERFCKERGVEVRHYHADNGIFASNGFREDVARCGQSLTFCGVGAHHQNGVAERRIQDLTQSARAMMAHAAKENPAVTVNLWPYALKHASYLRRIMPRLKHSKSPEELMSKSPVRPTTRFLHPFGCPVYVLRRELQSGKSLPKWQDRSRVGVYLGLSPQHATSVSLILNPSTGYISPQFHCVFDNAFDSCKTDANFSKVWAEKAGLEVSHLSDEATDYSRQPIPERIQVDFDTVPIHEEEGTQEILQDNTLNQPEIDNSGVNVADDIEENEGASQNTPESEGAQEVQESQAQRTRSGRRIKPTKRMRESSLLPKLTSFVMIFAYSCAVQNKLPDNTVNGMSQLFSEVKNYALPASVADNDTMYLKEAMNQEDREKFLEAMIKEVEDHTNRGHWRLTTRTEMRAKGYKHRPIMAVWSFKRKRNPVGEITRYKARLCCHGGQTIKGVHYDETFAPVVAWSTVRMMMTLAIINGWHARQIDFVLAFPQAKVQTDIYMMVPEKFEVRDGKLVLNDKAPHPSKQEAVTKLVQNVYGLSDASYQWNIHLKRGLLAQGFKQSEVDPCLFYKKDFIFLLYVDDAICMSPEEGASDKLIKDLKKAGFVLTDEGSMSAYLGLQITHPEEGTVELKQPAFIERLINAVGLKDERLHDTPADSVLHRDAKGEERKTTFHYRSVIGQLNYLAATTRPDIQFAVHQCARFSNDPKMVHEKAVKRVIRYLKRTKDQGLIMRVNPEEGLECFVDADFAGGYNKNNTENPRDCLSRTGYVVKYAGCPIIWSSKLQSTIALSTCEAEYMALSIATRELIYLMNLMDELKQRGFEIKGKKPSLRCKLWEDNVGAIELAKLPKLRPRTKHIAIQFHHFRSYTTKGLDGEPPRIEVKYVVSEQQQADILTKPLPRQQFQAIRKLLCGW